MLIQNYVLTQQRLETGFEQLVNLSSQERLSVRGVKPGREDVIVAGALLVNETLKAFQKSSVVVSDAGLLEGLMEEIMADFKVSASDS
jgi:exopolyphosphatase/guanosine-5'-triphosphate,3'-diphosphate pyrophosphatase